jgi:predicted HTH transcriptional regulator
MEKKTIVQRISKKDEDVLSHAQRYYYILSAINGLQLTKREIQLTAFVAVRGNISYSNIRKEFCSMYSSSSPTINNIISKLKKKGVLVKISSKIKVNPIISLDFNKDVILEIKLLVDVD